MKFISALKQIINNFEDAETLYNSEEGPYLATGYWLSEEDYFKLGQIIEDMEGSAEDV
jgi:hypothetical protein|nr:MAG TPA_asm: hypothetical protein [Caudoviricetes sp.]